jgi:hypothetical protein
VITSTGSFTTVLQQWREIEEMLVLTERESRHADTTAFEYALT